MPLVLPTSTHRSPAARAGRRMANGSFSIPTKKGSSKSIVYAPAEELRSGSLTIPLPTAWRVTRTTGDPSTSCRHRSGPNQVWKMDADGRHPRQITRHGGYLAFESYDRRWLFYSRTDGDSPLYRVPVDGGEETQVLPRVNEFGFCVTPSGILFSGGEHSDGIEFLSFETGKVSPFFRPDRANDGGTEPLARWPPLTISATGIVGKRLDAGGKLSRKPVTGMRRARTSCGSPRASRSSARLRAFSSVLHWIAFSAPSSPTGCRTRSQFAVCSQPPRSSLSAHYSLACCPRGTPSPSHPPKLSATNEACPLTGSSQLVALYFSSCGLGQFVHKHDPPRRLVTRQALPYKLAQIFCKGFARPFRPLQRHECAGPE